MLNNSVNQPDLVTNQQQRNKPASSSIDHATNQSHIINNTKSKVKPLAGPEGLALRYVITPQIFNAAAFISSMYSTVSCNFVNAHYDYNWELTEIFFKTSIGYGMLSKENASLNSEEKCYWYSDEDLKNDMFDLSFRIAVFANTIMTLVGMLNFLYSLFLWCKVVRRSSIRFLSYVTISCICSGVVSQAILVSNICRWERCDQFDNGTSIDTSSDGDNGDIQSQGSSGGGDGDGVEKSIQESTSNEDETCVTSYCTLGMGSYFTFLAIFLWICSFMVYVLLLKRVEKQHQMVRQRRIERIERAAQQEIDRLEGRDVERGQQQQHQLGQAQIQAQVHGQQQDKAQGVDQEHQLKETGMQQNNNDKGIEQTKSVNEKNVFEEISLTAEKEENTEKSEFIKSQELRVVVSPHKGEKTQYLGDEWA